MGNTVAPGMCMCRKDAGAAAVAVTTRGRRPKSFVTVAEVPAAPDAAAPGRLAVVTPRKQRGDVELEQQQDETTTRAGRGRSRARAGGVSWAGGRVGADDDDADAAAIGKANASAAAAVVTVKIVLKRKDAEALVARLNAQSARERKARMDELKGEFRAGDGDGDGDYGVGGASPAPCRDAWKPRLAPIKEN